MMAVGNGVHSPKEARVRRWDVRSLDVRPHRPEIISSSEESRAIAINLPAGEAMRDHEVHERAWLVLLDGELQITTPEGDRVEGGPGLVVEFEPQERHEVRAVSDARLFLLLTPWPGEGHPGAMNLDDKRSVRERARERAES